jgi:hypothetical protein
LLHLNPYPSSLVLALVLVYARGLTAHPLPVLLRHVLLLLSLATSAAVADALLLLSLETSAAVAAAPSADAAPVAAPIVRR